MVNGIRLLVPRLLPALESPESSAPKVSDSKDLGDESICISMNFPSDADASGSRITLEKPRDTTNGEAGIIALKASASTPQLKNRKM
jgi:hypothetical protein